MSYVRKRLIRYDHVCEVCKQKCRETRYVTFGKTWMCRKCFDELQKLINERFPNQTKIRHEEAVNAFNDFRAGITAKEKVVFT